MKRLIHKMLIAGTLLAAASACTREELPLPAGNSGGEEVLMALSLSAAPQTAAGEPGTRSIPDGSVEEGTSDDYQIEDFWLIEYDDGGHQIGTARYFTDLGDDLANVPSIPVIKPAGSETYTCVFIANTHSEAFNTVVGDITTLDKLKAALHTVRGESDTYTTDSDLLMSGTVEINNGTSKLDATLYRNIAKLTLRLSSAEGSGMTLTSVQVLSVSGRIAYADRLLEGTEAPYPAVETGGFFNYPAEKISVAPGNDITLTYYLPRNMRGTTASTTAQGKNNGAPEAATYIEIMAEDANGLPVRYTFYPGGNMTNDFNILPNKHYTLPITIKEKGNAETDSRVDDMGVIELAESNCYLIAPLAGTAQSIYCVPGITRSNRFWNSTDGAAEPGNVIGSADEWVAEVIWQDQPTRLIRFCDESGATDNSEVTGTDGDYYKGSGANFFRFKCMEGVEGNVLVGIRKADQTGDYTKREYLWSFHLWITSYAPDYTAAWENEKFVYQVAGGAVHRYADKTENGVWGSQYLNKYIMDRNIGALGAKADDGIDKTRGMYYQFGRKDPFPAEGVKLYDITGEHERNFGSNNTNISKVSGQALLRHAVLHPYIFYYPGTSLSDWMSGNTYTGALWNNPDWYTDGNGKSLFDPSPLGWKLPVMGIWDIFQGSVNLEVNASNEDAMQGGSANAGYWFYIDAAYGEAHESANVAFYPASGYRNVGSGSMGGERSYGYYWAATPNGATSGRYLYFYSTSVYPQSSNRRGYGFPVRCVQE